MLIVVISAYVDWAKLEGINYADLLKKPLDLDVLLPKIRGHLLGAWLGGRATA